MSEGKICKKCGVWKELEGFYPVYKDKEERVGKCVSCTAEEGKLRRGIKKLVKEGFPIYQTHHQCKECGECLPVDRFRRNKRLTKASICAICKQRLNREWYVGRREKIVRPAVTHHKCGGCEKVLPIEEFKNNKKLTKKSICTECYRSYHREWYAENKDTGKTYRKNNADKLKERKRLYYVNNTELLLLRNKKWRDTNKDSLRDKKKGYSKKYYEANKDKVKAVSERHKNSPARWETYGSQIPSVDEPREVNGLVEVSCKNCGARFTPTGRQCYQRIWVVRHSDKGESHLYCSETCKESCEVFGAQKLPKSLQSRRVAANKCQAPVRESLIKTQCSEKGMVECEVCGDIGSIELHHTVLVSDNNRGFGDASGMMLVCSGCHVKIHQTCK